MISGLQGRSEMNFSLPAGLSAFLLLVLLSFQKLGAQDFFFDNYSVEQGIGQSTIFDIHQDHNDFVWLGTRAGLSRFDGNEFINYTSEDGLAENAVRIIFRDQQNHLWFGHEGGGISHYNGKEFSVFSAPGEIFDSNITGIVSDNTGNLWVTSELSGAARIVEIGDSLSGSKYEAYIGADFNDMVFSIYKGNDGTLYFNTLAIVKTYNAEENDFRNFIIDEVDKHFQVTCLFEDNENNLWIGKHNGGIYKYDSGRDTVFFYDTDDGLAHNWITDIVQDKSGRIWVSTWGGGVTVFNNDSLITLNEENGLSDVFVRKLMVDHEGNVLIGSDENGIDIFKGFHFASYFPEDGLRNPQVLSMVRDKQDKIWFGTESGISILNRKSDKEEKFSDFPWLKSTRVLSLKEDNRGRIWMGTEFQGIFMYEKNNDNFNSVFALNNFIPSYQVKALEIDEDNHIWVGTLDGLLRYDPDREIVNRYTESTLSSYFLESDSVFTDTLNQRLVDNEILDLYHDPEGRIWISSRGTGLNYIENDELYYLYTEVSNIKDMTIDAKGNLWLATEANGVFQIDTSDGEVLIELKESDGLLANLINLIASDDEGNIYIGTNKGLNIYSPEAEKIYTYNDKNGFVGIETKPGAVMSDETGKLWFGTIKGVTSLDPARLIHSNLEPLTHITRFFVDYDRDLSPDIKLRHTENDVTFEYISICLANPEAVAYRIMLEGAEEDWRPVTTQTSVTYPSLAPGKYTFKVTARNNEGNWNTTPIEYSFTIKPPFYQTTWFILLCIFLGGVIIFAYVKIRERNLIIEKRILEEKVVERTAVVTAQKEQLAQKNKDITDSIRYAKRIQVAILPPEIPFENTFILFRPKDIVSGDFYWLEVIDGREYIAAVDCTGHGVPGAFMSIIGSNFLNKIVKEQKVYEPAKILNLLNKEVIDNLKSTDEDSTVYDGMDIALVCYDKEKSVLEYAGGYNPLFLVRSGLLQEIKADRFAIGRSSLAQENRDFTNHRIDIKRNDIIYIFSDGYADQFGGDSGKKFKVKPMKELLIAISEKSMEEQRSILNSTLDAWRGDIEQVDDVLVIGRKF